MLRPLADPVAIEEAASRALGEYLEVDRCAYGEVDAAAEFTTVHRDYRVTGMASFAGTHRMEDFGKSIIDRLRRGEKVVIDDVDVEFGTDAVAKQAFAAADTRAVVGIPLVKAGRLAVLLFVNHRQPRHWIEEDIQTLEAVGERTWAAVERARAEAALRASQAELAEADRRKDEFIAMLAHELRNPLAPIRTGLELIRLAGDTPGSVERVRAMMDRQIGHMVRLVDDLLDVSRITSGKIRLQRQPAPLNTLVNSAVEANRAAMAAKQIELTVNLPATLCVLDVDPTRFIQVISNLLHNAVKFTESGGSIRVSAHIDGGDEDKLTKLSLSVTDSGIGISPVLLPHIFDLFTQGDRGSSQPGLGIGLALAWRLVAMHDGEIEVRSDGPGKGSQFVITLPVSVTELAPQTSEQLGVRSLARRVVVIDDNHDAADVTAMLVEGLGGECRVVYDGLSGVREVLSYRPDVVLLDIGMPGFDGYETCARIRQELGREITVIALTGFGQEHDRHQAVRAGFDAHLTKPADPRELARLLSELPVNHDVRTPRTDSSDPQRP